VAEKVAGRGLGSTKGRIREEGGRNGLNRKKKTTDAIKKQHRGRGFGQKDSNDVARLSKGEFDFLKGMAASEQMIRIPSKEKIGLLNNREKMDPWQQFETPFRKNKWVADENEGMSGVGEKFKKLRQGGG